MSESFSHELVENVPGREEVSNLQKKEELLTNLRKAREWFGIFVCRSWRVGRNKNYQHKCSEV